MHCYFDALGHFELSCKTGCLMNMYSIRGMKYVSFLFAALIRNIPLHDKYFAS
jgi:hypothetical protein